ncbi:hypothetical protein Dimus_039234 [Dionaea muscipula]
MTKSQIKKTEIDISKRGHYTMRRTMTRSRSSDPNHSSLGQLLGSQTLKVLGQIHQQGQRRLEWPPTRPQNHHRSTKRTAPARGLVTKSEHNRLQESQEEGGEESPWKSPHQRTRERENTRRQ